MTMDEEDLTVQNLYKANKQQQKRIKELEAIIKSFADAPQCMHVPNWVVIKCENALKGGD